MIEGLKEMSCGNCGAKVFHIYTQDSREKMLIIECLACKSTSIVTPSIPKLDIAFGEGSEGRIVVM